jgi:mannitol/fructose-specific phosphotransferase system IIA component (Ntr-type)
LESTDVVTLADFTGEGLIVPRLQTRQMAGVIRELAGTFGASGGDWNVEELSRLALERESQMSTAMEFGAAFPHVRSKICPRLQFALGRFAVPVEWGGPGSLRVQFVFLNAIPAGDATGYLKLVMTMARLGKDQQLLQRFRDAGTARELLELLRSVPMKR